MQFFYLFAIFLISHINCRKIPDPFKDLEKLGDKAVQASYDLGESALDTLSPVLKAAGKADKAITGGFNGVLNKGLFKAENGAVQGLAEVVGVPVDLKDVHFYLASANAVKNVTKVDYHNPSDVASAKGNIFFITHGWTDSHNATWVIELTEALLKKYPEAHVVQVDWHKPAADQYPFSAFHTENVGEILANLTLNLVEKHDVPLKNIVLIGHSLGGQISGWAGKKFKKFSNNTLPLIVALDPAGPLFCLRPDSKRLNKHDAERVMVIHTNAGELGMLEPCGTIDFFPNGGGEQPGCAKINVIDLQSYLNPVSCAHVRSHSYLIEALKIEKPFPSRKCKTYTDFMMNLNCEDVVVHMGVFEVTEEGTFFLQTDSKPQFSLALKN